MRVFVTGGTGYVGANLVLRFLVEGHQVTVPTRSPRLPDALDGAECLSIPDGLLSHRNLESEMDGHDAVVHNALIWENEHDLEDTRASLAVFEAAASAGVRHLVYTSSTAVHRPFQPSMDEATPLQTSDLYGATKAANEQFLSATSKQTGLPFTTFRLGPVMGPSVPGTALKCDRRFAELVRAARADETITVVGGEGRQFIDVRHVAAAYAAALRFGGSGETYIAASSQVTPWEEIARRIVDLVGSGKVERLEAIEPPRFKVSKFESTFGECQTDWAWLEAYVRSCP